MNLRALQYFVKLADLRHFSKAADACFVSQPTLSTQVKKLEEELGVQLVERSPKLIMLTPVGEDIDSRARLVLRDIEQIRTVARRSSNPAEGALRVGLFPTLAPYYLPHVVPEIRRKYPSLRLQLAEEKTEDILRMLQQGQLDAALLALPVPGEGMQVVTLFEEPFVLALQRGARRCPGRGRGRDDGLGRAGAGAGLQVGGRERHHHLLQHCAADEPGLPGIALPLLRRRPQVPLRSVVKRCR